MGNICNVERVSVMMKFEDCLHRYLTPLQYNDQQLCTRLVNERQSNATKTSMEILADISKVQRNGACFNVDWSSFIANLKSPSIDNGNDRSWLVRFEMNLFVIFTLE